MLGRKTFTCNLVTVALFLLKLSWKVKNSNVKLINSKDLKPDDIRVFVMTSEFFAMTSVFVKTSCL